MGYSSRKKRTGLMALLFETLSLTPIVSLIAMTRFVDQSPPYGLCRTGILDWDAVNTKTALFFFLIAIGYL